MAEGSGSQASCGLKSTRPLPPWLTHDGSHYVAMEIDPPKPRIMFDVTYFEPNHVRCDLIRTEQAFHLGSNPRDLCHSVAGSTLIRICVSLSKTTGAHPRASDDLITEERLLGKDIQTVPVGKE
ncbi:hypothetical protein Bbelb_169550 [Branchiostoma belcheri]|nr:hypothetical protein Bbelb_169550 [Branchiostoma belcheri]